MYHLIQIPEWMCLNQSTGGDADKIWALAKHMRHPRIIILDRTWRGSDALLAGLCGCNARIKM